MNLKELSGEFWKQKKVFEEEKEKLEELKVLIKNEMDTQAIESFEDDEQNIFTYKEQTRRDIDRDKIKELLGEDTFKECVKINTFKTFRPMSREEREEKKQRYIKT